ncbi:MAG: acetyltransferase [Rubripirellula sp.]
MTNRKQLYIIGAGGHAKVIVRASELLGYTVAGIFDDAVGKQGQLVAGIPVLGNCEDLVGRPALPTVIGIGDNATRKRLSESLDLDWATIVHPAATVDKSAQVHPGSIVMAGSVIQADTTVGDHCIINSGATVDHDCRLDGFCHIAPGVNIAGHCQLAEGVLVGIGANMIPSIRVGSWTTIGAGATVVQDLPAAVIANGVPAKIR